VASALAFAFGADFAFSDFAYGSASSAATALSGSSAAALTFLLAAISYLTCVSTASLGLGQVSSQN
jgi:hypothetical protein